MGKPTILVLLNGSPVAFDKEVLKVPAIIEAWYPGQAGGSAVADVLFGDYNPAGRLPVTFYKSTSQLPSFEDYSMQNRTYRFLKKKFCSHLAMGLVLPILNMTITKFRQKLRQMKHLNLVSMSGMPVLSQEMKLYRCMLSI